MSALCLRETLCAFVVNPFTTKAHKGFHKDTKNLIDDRSVGDGRQVLLG